MREWEEKWKYEKHKKYELRKYQKNWKYGNLANMEDFNRNKLGSIVRGRQM